MCIYGAGSHAVIVLSKEVVKETVVFLGGYVGFYLRISTIVLLKI